MTDEFLAEVESWREWADLELIYRQGPCFAVNKPPGLLTQAPPHLDSVERRVKETIRRLEGKTGRVYLGVPHRLDRPVSGVLVLARHVRAARRISQQFQLRTVTKRYWAILQGRVEPAEGQWVDFLRKVEGESRSEAVPPEAEGARQAVLNYRVLGCEGGRSFLEIELLTGRHHQIRVQAAVRGWPVWGDEQYGAGELFGPPSEDPRQRWVALHARRLDFLHPMTRAPVELLAAPPWDEPTRRWIGEAQREA